VRLKRLLSSSLPLPSRPHQPHLDKTRLTSLSLFRPPEALASFGHAIPKLEPTLTDDKGAVVVGGGSGDKSESDFAGVANVEQVLTK
jgi:hypothetical protein